MSDHEPQATTKPRKRFFTASDGEIRAGAVTDVAAFCAKQKRSKRVASINRCALRWSPKDYLSTTSGRYSLASRCAASS
jgi:hypothetical protein